jgi:hypothetical protein
MYLCWVLLSAVDEPEFALPMDSIIRSIVSSFACLAAISSLIARNKCPLPPKA